MNKNEFTRLDYAMRVLGISSLELARHCAVSSSLISRWKKGERPLSARSKALAALCAAMIARDEKGVLDEVIAPFCVAGMEKAEALRLYLCEKELAALPARATPPEIQRSGSYIAPQQVLLGHSGSRQMILLMLDYVMQLPPGREVIVCVHSDFDLWLHNVSFAMQFLQKLNKAVKRGTSFLLINRRGFRMDNNEQFIGVWLVAHLRGILRSRYYEGEPPEESFVASIPGYWSGHTEKDDTAEDGVINVLYSDARNIRKDEAHCLAYTEKSLPAGQYDFLQYPGGNEKNKQCWQPGPLPLWGSAYAPPPTGNFSAICRVPSLGIMTKAEFAEVLRKNAAPPLPDYLFPATNRFASGTHRLILCRDDIREAFTKVRRRNEPLSILLNRKVLVPRDIFVSQMRRIYMEMDRNDAFEVALVPRSAFEKLQLEIICWQNSSSVGWLQGGNESVFASEPITSGSFYMTMDHAWECLQKGWKRKKTVRAQLAKWLAGKELTVQPEDSAFVRNWDVTPRP